MTWLRFRHLGKFLMVVMATVVKLVRSLRMRQCSTHFHILSGVVVSWCLGVLLAMFLILFHMLGNELPQEGAELPLKVRKDEES